MQIDSTSQAESSPVLPETTKMLQNMLHSIKELGDHQHLKREKANTAFSELIKNGPDAN